MKKLMQISKEVKKIVYLANFCLFMGVILCGCSAQQEAKESELILQLQDKEETALQQTGNTGNTGKEAVLQQEQSIRNEVALQQAENINITETTALTKESQAIQSQQEIYVYICGAVNNAGVYRTGAGSRLFEVVELAGGFSSDADETCLNLAREAQDGEQIVILTKEETAALAEKGMYHAGSVEQGSTKNTNVEKSAVQGGGLVNINTASVSELTTVTGIGESRAQAIIAYREANGGFQTIEDIKKVDGIKDGLFAKIKDKITV